MITQMCQGTRSRGKTLSPATQNRFFALSRKVSSFGVEREYIEHSSFKLNLTKEAPRTRVLSDEEEAALVEACNPPLKQFVIVALQTASRFRRALGDPPAIG